MGKICQHRKTREVYEIEDGEDVRKLVCAAEGCDFILNKAVVLVDGAGEKRLKPVAVPPEQQTGYSMEDFEEPEEALLTAAEMTALAIRTKEETIGKRAREVAKEILAGCAEVVLEGKYEHLLAEGEVGSKVLKAAVKELRGCGYTVAKPRPEPGVGVWVAVKWPTTSRGKTGKKVPAKAPAEKSSFKFKKKTDAAKKRAIQKQEKKGSAPAEPKD